MIFVTVGTGVRPLDRVVAMADELARTGEEVVVQSGTSRVRPNRARAIEFLPFPRFERLVREARVVVSHAGIGSVATCLRLAKRPILVPRRRGLGENVDDHQLAFAYKLEGLGLATTVEDVRNLPAAVACHDCVLLHPTGLSEELAEELVSYIERVVYGEVQAPGAEQADSNNPS